LDEFVVGGRNGPKVLNFIEEALDEVALAVKCEIAIAFGLSVAFGGNYGHDFSLRKTIEERIIASHRASKNDIPCAIQRLKP
jgi:hypothetical protein